MLPLIYKAIFLLVILLYFIFILYLVFLRKIKREYLIVLILIFTGFLITFYIRFVVYNNVIFASSDESNYIDLLYRFNNNKFTVISGPGYIYFVNFLKYITNLDFLYLVPLIAIIVSILYITIFYFLYKFETKNKIYSFICSIVILTSSYFLWPMIEGRPQQIGMILFFISAVSFYKYLSENKNKYYFIFLISYFLVFIFHSLSFFLLSSCIILLLVWNYLDGIKKSLINLIIFIVLLCFFILLFFQDWFIYSNMKNALYYSLLSNYPVCLLNLLYIKVFVSVIFLLVFLSILIFLKKTNLLSKMFNLIKNPKVFYSLFFSIIFSLFLQFILEFNKNISFYKYSGPYFLFFQLGNIFFGLIFLIGFYKLLKENKKMDLFFKYSIILMFIGFVLVCLSLFFPNNFSNGLIRIINYWTMFASPIVVYPLLKINNKFKVFLSVLLAIFILLSIINASRDPYFFNYEYYWDNSDYNAMKYICPLEGTFLIKNTQNDFYFLSKESTYILLIDIISNRENMSCKSYILVDNQTVPINLEYKEGYNRIYRVEGESKPVVWKDDGFSLKNIEWNKKCPIK